MAQPGGGNPSKRLVWLGAMKRPGVEGFRSHDLRHSAASFVATNGASLPEFGAVLGYRSAQTAKLYSHLAQEHTHRLVQATMGKLLGVRRMNMRPDPYEEAMAGLGSRDRSLTA